MELSRGKQLFELLYESLSGYKLSSEAREKLTFFDRSSTYGEIIPSSFYEMVSAASPQKGEIFYDLGSGTGKAVIAASLLFPFAKTVGIEILPNLYESSLHILERLKVDFKPYLDDYDLPQIEFHQEDFLNYNFSDADIIFAHATCFHNGQIRNLSKAFQKLKKGTRLLIVTKTLENPSFILIDRFDYPFSWGTATLHLYKKVV